MKTQIKRQSESFACCRFYQQSIITNQVNTSVHDQVLIKAGFYWSTSASIRPSENSRDKNMSMRRNRKNEPTYLSCAVCTSDALDISMSTRKTNSSVFLVLVLCRVRY